MNPLSVICYFLTLHLLLEFEKYLRQHNNKCPRIHGALYFDLLKRFIPFYSCLTEQPRQT